MRRLLRPKTKRPEKVSNLTCLLGSILFACWLPINTIAASQELDNSQQVIAAIEKINWITEEYPPFNYRDPDSGELTGASVDVLITIFRKLGLNKGLEDIKMYPWARGYHKVLNEPGTALFSTTYTHDRLQKMKFVGPVVPNVVSVISRKSDQIKINSIQDLNQLKISVVRDDIGEQLLLAAGVNASAIDQLNSGLSMVKKLEAGRVDAVAYAHAVTLSLFDQANINPDDYEIVHVLKQSDMGYTFHHSTDARILEPIRKVLDELTVSGELAQILAKYGVEAP
ncbi:MAG: ABC transporter substrate-binding protein [Pseudomonadota bacterium]